MENLLKAARVPDIDIVNFIKIQLMEVARTWWQIEGDRLEQPINWENFTRIFYKWFFPKIALRELEQQFINLK